MVDEAFPISSQHGSSLDLKKLGRSRFILYFLVVVVLCHNVLFQFLVLPYLPFPLLQAYFSEIQFARNLAEIGLIAVAMQIIGLPWSRWRQRAWPGNEALQAVSSALVLMSIASWAMQQLAPLSEPKLGLEATSFAWILINSVLITPFREEIFFRGLVWTLLSWHGGRKLAIYGSALLFSAAHLPAFDLQALSSQFIFGLLLAYLLPRYGLGVCIVTHMTFNALAVVWQPVAAPQRQWLLAHPWLLGLLSLGLLTLFFRGLFDWVQGLWVRREEREHE